MKLSVIVCSLTGEAPRSLQRQVAGRNDVELIAVKGIRPVGRARNDGLKRATGEYLSWVDSDDEVADDWLSEIECAITTKPDVVVLGYTWVLSATHHRTRIWSGGDLMKSVLSQRDLTPEVWHFVVRRSLWDGVRFDDRARTLEDWEIAPRLLAKAHTVERIVRPIYRYLASPVSLTHRADESLLHESFERAIARIPEIKRLGLWRKHAGAAMSGVGYMVYCSAETLALNGRVDSRTVQASVKWIRRHLIALLVTSSPLTFRAKWIFAALGAWWIVRWYYERKKV